MNLKEAMTKAAVIKICGLSTPKTMDAALSAGADMVGLVFFAKSPRHVALSQACDLADQARGRAQIVALTVDMDPAGLSRIHELVKPDWFQFHGAETPEACAAAKVLFGSKVMKAISVSHKADLKEAERYFDVCDMLLLDAKPPAGAVLPGGNGISFEWSLVQDFISPAPVMLSGGLNASNVKEAMDVSGLHCVDVSSGVEREKGVKDSSLIMDFVMKTRSAKD